MTTTLGVDVARYGNDRTAIAVQTNGHLHSLHTIEKTDLVTQAHQIETLARTHNDLTAINIDDTGLGGGLTDILMDRLGALVRPVNYGTRPPGTLATKYANTATALWFNLKSRLDDGAVSISPTLPHLEELTRELTSQEWEFTPDRSRIRIKSKADVKAHLGRSPDLADAVLLAFWEAPVLSPDFYDVGV